MTANADHASFEARVGPFRDALRDLVAEERDIRQRSHLLPAVDSAAMAEMAAGQTFTGREPWGDDAVQGAYSMVSVLMMAAEDHILAVCKLFDTGPEPVYAHMSIARVA